MTFSTWGWTHWTYHCVFPATLLYVRIFLNNCYLIMFTGTWFGMECGQHPCTTLAWGPRSSPCPWSETGGLSVPLIGVFLLSVMLFISTKVCKVNAFLNIFVFTFSHRHSPLSASCVDFCVGWLNVLCDAHVYTEMDTASAALVSRMDVWVLASPPSSLSQSFLPRWGFAYHVMEHHTVGRDGAFGFRLSPDHIQLPE